MDEFDLDRLLKICRLRLDEKERKAIEEDLRSILHYFDSISSVECEELEPAYQPIKVEQKLREDKVQQFPNSDLLLKGTKTYRFYVVGPDI